MKPSSLLTNPAFLKLELLTKGMRLEDEIAESDEIGAILNRAPSVTDGMELILPGSLAVNVPIKEKFARKSPYLFVRDGKGYAVLRNEFKTAVKFVAPPKFYLKRTSSGILMGDVARINGEFLFISPSTKCDLLKTGSQCLYCPKIESFGDSPPLLDVSDVLQIIRSAHEEGFGRHVWLVHDFTERDDAGIASLEPYVKTIKKHFDVFLGVEIEPPKLARCVEYAYAMGADALCMNMDVYDEEIMGELCPGKASSVGRERYLESLSRASAIFPSGCVFGALIVGLESPWSSVKAIDEIIKTSSVPLLQIFRPIKGTPVENIPAPKIEDFLEVFAHNYRASKKSRLNVSWIKHLSTFFTPMEGKFFTDDNSKSFITMQDIIKHPIGGKVSRTLATIRRSLKVKDIGDDSLDSASL